MAVDGTPDTPIIATRVEPVAAPVAAAAPLAAAASPEPAAAAPAAAAATPVAVEAAPAIETVAERPSLLESFGKDADKPAVEAVKPEAASDKPDDKTVKPAEAKPADPAKPAEAAKPEGEPKPIEAEKPAEPAALAPIEYAYELPPTLKVDDALKGEITTAFDAFRTDPAKGSQALIDLHAKIMSDYDTRMQAQTLANQHKAFNATRDTWNKDWMADPEIGGAGYQTSMRAIARMRDQFVSDALPGTPKYAADMKSWEEFCRITGGGDHPALGRLLHNVARAFDEPAPPPANTRPPPNHGQKPGSGREKLYGPSQKTS